MGNSNPPPVDQTACYEDSRFTPPFTVIILAGTCHYFLQLFLFYKRENEYSPFWLQWLIMIPISILHFIQFILDWIAVDKTNAYAARYPFSRQNCAQFMMMTAPIAIHYISYLFALLCTYTIHGYSYDEEERWNMISFKNPGRDLGKLLTLFCVFQFLIVGLILHFIAGVFVYIWYTLIVVLILGIFVCFLYYFQGFWENKFEENLTSISIKMVNVWILMVIFLIFYVTIIDSMNLLYRGDHYIDSWLNAWKQRATNKYFTDMESWEHTFSFIVMLL